MRIEKISIKNFYSFVDTELNFKDYSGLTLIKGVNKDSSGSNGSGKSALLEAVFFGLTGKTVRKSTEVAIVNNKNKRGCVVEIFLDNGIMIRRSKKPTKLELFIDGENCTKDHASSTQAYIDDLLNINYKILLSSMFFGQSNTLNFLDADSNDKRIILRNFLNLEEIFSLRDKIKYHKSVYWGDLKVQDSLIKEFEKSKSSLEGDLSKINSENNQYLAEYEQYLDISLDDILGTERAISDANRKKATLLSDINREIRSLDDLLAQAKNNKCKGCGQKLPQTYWDRNKKNIEDKRENIKILKERRDSVSIPEPYPITSMDYSSVLELKELVLQKSSFETQIESLAEKIADAQNKKIESNKKYEIMRFWEKAFSEQGIIKYIIRNVLSFFNDKINYYLSFLTNQGYYLEFNEELSEKIMVSEEEVHYISLSGGEKRKINLCVLLALRDLLSFTDKNQLDIIFFDEVAENLDEGGIYGLYALLKEIKKTKNIFVITHNKHLKTLLDSSPRITIIKDQGESKIMRKVRHGDCKAQ